ncbi:MAG: DUF4276 family protein [Anaerolineae bacterium]|nr:DUF4276 family protein [Anaerolineae bacterium]
MKFVLFVEGHTEKKTIAEFLKRWLDPRLDQKVGIQAVRFDGWSEMVNDLPVKVPKYLHGPSNHKIIAVIALLDLYGPNIYPDHLFSARKRMGWAVNELQSKAGEKHFRMFFAVHEIEAWLLSDPNIFPPAVTRALTDKVRCPESINFDEPPSALLERLYRKKQRRHYKKVTDGSVLFKKLDPDRVYDKCPVFKQMMDDMLALAKNAGL